MSETRQQRAAREARERVEWFLGDERGRRLCMDLLQQLGFFGASADPYEAGRRSAAAEIIGGFSPKVPLLVGLMFTEHYERIEDGRVGGNPDGDDRGDD